MIFVQRCLAFFLFQRQEKKQTLQNIYIIINSAEPWHMSVPSVQMWFLQHSQIKYKYKSTGYKRPEINEHHFPADLAFDSSFGLKVKKTFKTPWNGQCPKIIYFTFSVTYFLLHYWWSLVIQQRQSYRRVITFCIESYVLKWYVVNG
jgi:hypothetical protein